jgi:hypothetical protein
LLTDLRTALRYFMVQPLPALVGNIPVEIIDLSSKGGRIALTTTVPVGTSHSVTIGYRNRTITVRASILWCQIDQLLIGGTIDRYLGGMVFDEASSSIAELLNELIEASKVIPIADGRNEDRFQLTAPMTAAFGMTGPVGLLDLSSSGACIAVSQRLPQGVSARLRFQVDEETGPVDVEGTVVWCRAIEGAAGLRVGLQIGGEQETLRRVIDRLCVRDEARIDLTTLRRKFELLRTQPAYAAAIAV